MNAAGASKNCSRVQSVAGKKEQNKCFLKKLKAMAKKGAHSKKLNWCTLIIATRQKDARHVNHACMVQAKHQHPFAHNAHKRTHVHYKICPTLQPSAITKFNFLSCQTIKDWLSSTFMVSESPNLDNFAMFSSHT